MNQPAAAPAEASPHYPDWRRYLTLALLVIVAILSYVDRQIFGIFMPAIGKELGIGHQELGFIAGLSFSVFYLIAAFPIARLADRGHRPGIIAVCVTVWSLATAACSLAGSGLQLVLLRIGLAAGEGGAGPAAQSLLLHIFPPQRRALAISALLAASAVGLGAGGWIGGILSQHMDWRGALVTVGLPGLLVALAVWLLAIEPRRHGSAAFVPPPQLPLREVLRQLGSSVSLRWTAATITLVSSAGFPFLIWSGTFYQTVHGFSVREAGDALFLPISGGLVIGNVLAGWLGDRFGRGRPRYLGWLAAIGLVLAFPFGIAMAQVSDARLSLVMFFVYHVLVTIHLAPMQVLAFAQVPPAMRAMLGASINMVITLCGIGIGTWLVGALSSAFAARYGDLSLRYALTSVCISLPLGAVCAVMAARTARMVEEWG